MWYTTYTDRTDLLPEESKTTSTSPSSHATTPRSLRCSPFLLPSTCVCPATPPLPAKSTHATALPAPPSFSAAPLAMPSSRARAVDVLRAEARAILAAAERLSQATPLEELAVPPTDSFDRAVEVALEALRPRCTADGRRLRRSKAKLVWCGVGKSGLIGQKLHATSLSVGVRSAFLHPIEALHGDLGMVERRDVVIVLSNSGATSEVLALTPHLKARGARIIALCANPDSALALQSDAWVDCRLPLLHHPAPHAPPSYSSPAYDPDAVPTPGLTPASSEADGSGSSSSSACSSLLLSDEPGPKPSVEPRRCNPNAQEPEAWASVPAPSSSTTLALAMGDALVFSIAQELGYGKAQFALNHPNGDLGRQLRLERERAAQHKMGSSKDIAAADF